MKLLKLFNKAPIDTHMVEKVLLEAARGLRVRTDQVAVVVSRSNYGTNGLAHIGHSFKDPELNISVSTDCGMFKISLPVGLSEDPSRCAERFYNTARHEWAHIRDYQDQGGRPTKPFSVAPRGGRRPNHDVRPEELRAYDYVDEADRKIKRNQSILLELAQAIEAYQRGKRRGKHIARWFRRKP